jgi:hypothetical protein
MVRKHKKEETVCHKTWLDNIKVEAVCHKTWLYNIKGKSPPLCYLTMLYDTQSPPFMLSKHAL